MKILGTVFLTIMGLHVLHALIVNRLGRRDSNKRREGTSLFLPSDPLFVVLWTARRLRDRRVRMAVLTQTVMFAMACWLGSRHEVFSRELISPIHIGIGLVAGHLIFGLSLLITHRSLRDAATHFVDFGSLWEYVVENPRILMQFIMVGVGEEVIYRVAMQPLLISWTSSAVLGILITALVFSVVHEHFFKNDLLQSSEFLGFALLLGVLYYVTGSLILVIVIHAVRNIEISFLELLVRSEETGGEEEAQREADYMMGERMLVMVLIPGIEPHVACFEYEEGPNKPALAPTSACRSDYQLAESS